MKLKRAWGLAASRGIVMMALAGAVVMAAEEEEALKPLPDLQELAKRGQLREAFFVTEGAQIMAGTPDGRLGLWETSSGKPTVAGKLAELRGRMGQVLDARKQRVLVTMLDEQKGVVYDLESGQALSPPIKRETRADDWELPAVFTPDGEVVLAGTAEGGYRVTKVESGQVLAQIVVPHLADEGEPLLMPPQFSADGKFAFLMDGKGTLRRYATSTWRESGPAMARTKGMRGHAWSFALQRGCTWAATISDEADCGGVGTVQLWSTADGEALGAPIEGSWGIGARFIGSGTRVIVRPGQGRTRIIDLRRPGYEVVLPVHDDLSASNALAIGNGRAVISWMHDQKLTRTPLDVEGGEKAVTYEAPGRIGQVLESPDREWVYAVVVPPTGSKKKDPPQESWLVKLDARTLEKKAALRLESEYANYCKIEFTPDGSRILLGDGRVKLIATEMMEEMEVTKRDGS